MRREEGEEEVEEGGRGRGKEEAVFAVVMMNCWSHKNRAAWLFSSITVRPRLEKAYYTAPRLRYKESPGGKLYSANKACRYFLWHKMALSAWGE